MLKWAVFCHGGFLRGGEAPGRSRRKTAYMAMASPGNASNHAASTARALAAGLRLQALVALALAGLLLLADGRVAAYSSLCGSLAVYVPSLLFTRMVAGKIGGDTGAFLRAAAVGEVGKLFLTGLLCALVFIGVRPLAAGWFFTGMIGLLLTGWIGLARAIR